MTVSLEVCSICQCTIFKLFTRVLDSVQ